VFGAVGVVASVVTSRLLGTLALEKHTHEVIIQAFHGLHQLERIQDVVNGGDKRKLAEPPASWEAWQEFGRTLDELHDKVKDNDEQQQRVLRLQRQVGRLNVALSGDKPVFHRVIPANQLLDQMKEEVRDFIRTEEGLLAQRRARTEQQTRQSAVVIGVAVGLALLLTVLLSLQVARSVTQPVQRLRE